jgi:integrase
MAVYTRPDSKNYWYSFLWNGARIQRSAKTSNKRIAEQVEAARRIALAQGEVGIKPKAAAPTLAEFSTKFLEHVRVDNADKPHTVTFYEDRMAVLVASKLKDLRLDEIVEEHLNAYKSVRRRAGKAVSTCNRELATLRKALRLAVEWGIIAKHVKVKLAKGENKRDFVLAQEDEVTYLAVCPPLLRHIATMMLDCACRPEEVHRLKWSQLADGTITIYKGKGTGSRRSVTMTDRVKEIVNSIKHAPREKGERLSEWVFPAPTIAGHANASTYKKLHAKALTDSGVPKHVPYSWRHTCITRWAANGMQAPSIQYLAGHEDIRTSMEYCHLVASDAQAHLLEARAKMEVGR